MKSLILNVFPRQRGDEQYLRLVQNWHVDHMQIILLSCLKEIFHISALPIQVVSWRMAGLHMRWSKNHQGDVRGRSLVVTACGELWSGALRTICLTALVAMQNGQGQTRHQFHQNNCKRVNLRIKGWFLLNWWIIWLWMYTADMEIVQRTSSKSDDVRSPCC